MGEIKHRQKPVGIIQLRGKGEIYERERERRRE